MTATYHYPYRLVPQLARAEARRLREVQELDAEIQEARAAQVAWPPGDER